MLNYVNIVKWWFFFCDIIYFLCVYFGFVYLKICGGVWFLNMEKKNNNVNCIKIFVIDNKNEVLIFLCLNKYSILYM